MNNSKSLGRGLANLIPDLREEGSDKKESHSPYKEILLKDIQADPNQPRKNFSLPEIQELSETILDLGIIEPIIVCPTHKKQENLSKKESIQKSPRYQIISGERRYRAAKIAGYKRIPAIIKKTNPMQALELGIIENIQREDLNPIEEATAYQQWIDQTGFKPSALAKKIGKNRSTVTNLLRILKLSTEIKEMIMREELTVGLARPLLSIANAKKQEELGQKAVKEGWNARKMEAEVAKILNRPEKKKSTLVDANVREKEEQLFRVFGAKVKIHPTKNGNGTIKIQYANLEEFDRIFWQLKNKPFLGNKRK